MATLEEVAKVVAYLAAAYPRFELRKETVRVYHDLLNEFGYELLQAAARHVAATRTFFPAASELRAAAMELMARARGELTPEEAWVEVQRAISHYGWYGETDASGGWAVPRMLDALTQRAMEGLGGWRMVCASENVSADRAHFLRIYEGLQRAERGEAFLLPAVRAEVNRLTEGLKVPRLVAPGEQR